MKLQRLESAQHHLLIADDEPLIGRTLGHVFRQRGFEVSVVTDGCAAISALQITAFDVVITDYCMPGANGLAVAVDVERSQDQCVVFVLSAHVGGRAAR